MQHTFLGLWLLLSSGIVFGQKKFSSMTPIINLVDTKTKALEKDERYVVKLLLDVLQRDMSDARNSTQFVFSRGVTSNIMVLGDSDKISALELRLYQRKNERWNFIRLFSGVSEIKSTFTPSESALYKLEVKAAFKAGKDYTHFGLIIDQEQ